LLPLIFVTIATIILILLGNWQLARLDEKQNFIQTIEFNIANPAISIQDLDTNVPNYSKIKLSGTFLPGKNAFLYGRRSALPEKDGYYLLSAFTAEDGKIYTVSRGWLPQSIKNNMDNFITDQESETIEAIILPGEKKNFFVPENDRKNNIWFTLDLNMAAEVIDSTVTDFYLMQIDSQNLPKGAVPLKTTHLNKVRNDHLEYAITWYSLAAGLLLVFIIYSRKKTLLIY
jgi:surfeit locus 1 family protein